MTTILNSLQMNVNCQRLPASGLLYLCYNPQCEPKEESYGTVAVAATATLILAASFNREEVTVQNVHATQVLYIGFDSSVATTTGATWGSSCGWLSMKVR